jgi:pyruvate dehydrogenase E2 component (dihydrolipoamide acetyltransferase)/4,5:9,10-diseco-3-hydroxy-5,9,17-trioxoandrosta-1(10),2-diene-4-oate hydrolase
MSETPGKIMNRFAERSHASDHRRPRRRLRRWALSVVAVPAAVLLAGAYGWQPAEADFRSPYLAKMGSRYADTPIARFHYVQAGSGSPVVLLSPGGTSVIGWKDQVGVLARDHTVYVVDLPGQRYTRLRDPDFGYDLDAMTAAVGSFMDAVGVRQAGLAGNSWSGGWALAFRSASSRPGHQARPAGRHRAGPARDLDVGGAEDPHAPCRP